MPPPIFASVETPAAICTCAASPCASCRNRRLPSGWYGVLPPAVPDRANPARFAPLCAGAGLGSVFLGPLACGFAVHGVAHLGQSALPHRLDPKPQDAGGRTSGTILGSHLEGPLGPIPGRP